MPLRKIAKTWYLDDYINGKRVRRKLSGNRDVAKRIRDEILKKADLSRFGIAPDNYSLSDIKDRFLQEVRPRVSDTTHEGYAVMLSQALEFIGTDIPLHQIRHRFNDYTNHRQQKGISDHTMNVTLGLFKRMLAYGVNTTLIPFNPMADVPKLRERKRPLRALTQKEITLLLEHSGRWHIVWLTFILTSLRKTELVRLRVRDIDKEACTLLVRRSKTEAGVRTVYIHSALQTALWPLLQGKGSDDYIFTTSMGTPLKNNLRREFLRCVGRAGINPERVGLHSLRKTFASLLASVDAHQKKTSVMMGHKRTSLTMDVYTDVFPGDLKEAVERIKIKGVGKE